MSLPGVVQQADGTAFYLTREGDMVDQIADTPLVARRGTSPVITRDFHETLSKPAARAFERFCAIHDGLPYALLR